MLSSNRGLGLLRAMTQALEGWLRFQISRPTRAKLAGGERSGARTAKVDDEQGVAPAASDREPVAPSAAPPPDWLERTRSPGPPADWLERVEKANSAATQEGALELSGRALSEEEGPRCENATQAPASLEADGANYGQVPPPELVSLPPGAARQPPSSKVQNSPPVRSRAQPGSAPAKMERRVSPAPAGIGPEEQEQIPPVPSSELDASHKQDVDAGEQRRAAGPLGPPATIRSPQSSQTPKRGTGRGEAVGQAPPAVVIRAGRPARRAPAKQEQPARHQPEDPGQRLPSNTASERTEHPEWPSLLESSDGTSKTVDREQVMRGESPAEQAGPITSMSHPRMPPVRLVRQGDGRLGEERTGQGKSKLIRLPGPPQARPVPPRRSQVTHEPPLTGERGKDLEEDRFVQLPAAEAPMREPELFIIRQGQVSNRRPDLDPWPELPDREPEDVTADMSEAVRGREHLERLNAEQRGVEWSG